MEAPAYKLLSMYLYILSRRARAKGIVERVTVTKLVGAIMTSFLLAHQERIMDEYKKLKLEKFATTRDLRKHLPAGLANLLSELQPVGNEGFGESVRPQDQ